MKRLWIVRNLERTLPLSFWTLLVASRNGGSMIANCPGDPGFISRSSNKLIVSVKRIRLRATPFPTAVSLRSMLPRSWPVRKQCQAVHSLAPRCRSWLIGLAVLCQPKMSKTLSLGSGASSRPHHDAALIQMPWTPFLCGYRLKSDLRGLGFARSWNFQHPTEQITALGLEKTEPGHGRAINGVVVPVLTKEGMEALDEREVGYKRVEVTCDKLKPLGWPQLPHDARVWMYVPCGRGSEQTPGVALVPASFTHPLLQSYVDVCILGCLEYSEEFAIEFINTTSGWDGPWLNDRKLARRPWVHQPSYKVIDELLTRIIPDEFKNRMLPSEFSLAYMKKSQNAPDDQNMEK